MGCPQWVSLTARYFSLHTHLKASLDHLQFEFKALNELLKLPFDSDVNRRIRVRINFFFNISWLGILANYDFNGSKLFVKTRKNIKYILNFAFRNKFISDHIVKHFIRQK
ncbi:hypothetical protein BpHYR1_030877 [Brachionus plicatilis]|uniref:Uncharacterized protein n=1 Tax=Brachionus plicatilis TaxID=10195 RepID=A0A3M7QJ58_BRAPC|nr:hypothetical protein BpHYR1_030877 [Brachionus plicatilis]